MRNNDFDYAQKCDMKKIKLSVVFSPYLFHTSDKKLHKVYFETNFFS